MFLTSEILFVRDRFLFAFYLIGVSKEKNEKQRPKRPNFVSRGEDAGNCKAHWRRLAKRRRAIPDTAGGAWRPRFTCEKHFRSSEERPAGAQRDRFHVNYIVECAAVFVERACFADSRFVSDYIRGNLFPYVLSVFY